MATKKLETEQKSKTTKPMKKRNFLVGVVITSIICSFIGLPMTIDLVEQGTKTLGLIVGIIGAMVSAIGTIAAFKLLNLCINDFFGKEEMEATK